MAVNDILYRKDEEVLKKDDDTIDVYRSEKGEEIATTVWVDFVTRFVVEV